jgi:hypothetical protein
LILFRTHVTKSSLPQLGGDDGDDDINEFIFNDTDHVLRKDTLKFKEGRPFPRTTNHPMKIEDGDHVLRKDTLKFEEGGPFPRTTNHTMKIEDGDHMNGGVITQHIEHYDHDDNDVGNGDINEHIDDPFEAMLDMDHDYEQDVAEDAFIDTYITNNGIPPNYQASTHINDEFALMMAPAAIFPDVDFDTHQD